MERITPPEVEQKFLAPELLSTGVAKTAYSWHWRNAQVAAILKRNPDFVHHPSALQFSLASDLSSRAA